MTAQLILFRPTLSNCWIMDDYMMKPHDQYDPDGLELTAMISHTERRSAYPEKISRGTTPGEKCVIGCREFEYTRSKSHCSVTIELAYKASSDVDAVTSVQRREVWRADVCINTAFLRSRQATRKHLPLSSIYKPCRQGCRRGCKT